MSCSCQNAGSNLSGYPFSFSEAQAGIHLLGLYFIKHFITFIYLFFVFIYYTHIHRHIHIMV